MMMNNNIFKIILMMMIIFIKTKSRYKIIDIEETRNGLKGHLKLFNNIKTRKEEEIHNNIENLLFNFYFESENRIRLQIKDEKLKRFEVPEDVIISKTSKVKPLLMNYQLIIDDDDEWFSFKIIRKYDNFTIFDMSNYDFLYCNQLIEITTKILLDKDKDKSHFYGLGEHKTNFHLNSNYNYSMWNSENGGTPKDKPLYGSHPFYMNLLNNGSAHGVFFLNSNAMNVEINSNKGFLKWRTIGGIVDMFFFVGNKPKDIVKEYLNVIGKPAMPAYWTLGNHQSRWGYASLNITKNIVNDFLKYKFPLDTIWNDLDYMDHMKDFTNHPVTFPTDEYQQFIDDLKKNDMHYVHIIDPGLKNESNYYPFEEGMKRDIFIKRFDGSLIENLCWPGYTAWPDFFNPETMKFWEELIVDHLDKFHIDGIWIDMNEMSCGCDGECYPSQKRLENPKRNVNSFTFDPMNPPYLPIYIENLSAKTLRADSITSIGILYDTKNLYSFQQVYVTYEALKKATNKRPFILTRSTFSGSHRYAAHWLGDSASTFEDLKLSVSTLLSFSLFGFTLSGADICGFMGFTFEELCIRWYELGSFYGFMRNHNNLFSNPQEPWEYNKRMLNPTRKVTLERYSLLPYYYTVHFLGFRDGETYLRPIFFEFFDETGNIPFLENQFMIGDALMIIPCLEESALSVKFYVPDAIWYNYYTGKILDCERKEFCVKPSPYGTPNMFLRGGKGLFKKIASYTTSETRRNNFQLLVGLDEVGKSQGYLYIDDGISLDSFEKKVYTSLFVVGERKNDQYYIETEIENDKFIATNTNVELVTIYGVQLNSVSNVTVNGIKINDYKFDNILKVLKINNINVTILKKIEIIFY